MCGTVFYYLETVRDQLDRMEVAVILVTCVICIDISQF